MKKWVALLLFLAMMPFSFSGVGMRTGIAEDTETPQIDSQDEAQNRKVVYLTFDDGPKQSTPELLDLLEKLDVPATFFLLGFAVKAFPEYTKMIYDRGYPVGCHTMDHSSSGIKREPESLGRVIERFNEQVRMATGDETYSADLFRFPGGSTSYPSRAKHFLTDHGIAWFDWSTLTGDTESGMHKWEDLYRRVLQTSPPEEEVVILLAHDGKPKTLEALPEIVRYYREMGFEFRTLSLSEEDRALLVRCPANMGLPE